MGGAGGRVGHAGARVPSDRSRDSAQLSLRRHVRWSGKRSGNEHFCLSERPSHFSKSALRADIVIHCLREPRGQDAKRIVIIWRWKDGRSFEQLAGCRASQNHRSNAACTRAAAVKAAAPVGGSRRGRQNVPTSSQLLRVAGRSRGCRRSYQKHTSYVISSGFL